MTDLHEALGELAALARAHLEWERELGNRELPEAFWSEPVDGVAVAAVNDEAVQQASDSATDAGGVSDAAVASSTVSDAAVASSTVTNTLQGWLGALSTTEDRVVFRSGEHLVHVRGNPRAEVAFVASTSEGNAEHQGLASDSAGMLLDRMIAAMGLAPDDVYICVLAGRAGMQQQSPRGEDAGACWSHISRQMTLLKPRIIVGLGRDVAAQMAEGLSGGGNDAPSWRGSWTEWAEAQVLLTYHPAYLMAHREAKRAVWEDLKRVVRRLGRTLPSRKKDD